MEQIKALRGELARRCPSLELRTDEPMAKYTTFRVGGPAALMALPKTEEEARAALQAARALGVEPFFLGNGSNLLVPDEGTGRFLIKLSGRYGADPLNRVREAEGASDKLAGQIFVITGTLSLPREHFKAEILKAGGKVSDSVSSKTTYVLAGENAGSKLQKAQKLNVPVLSEEAFMKLISED